ncbi:MAG TPA: ubiquitin-like domain-containing protein [Verrucomicrobiae bacterium]|nr:ubiquitin-like domain-containing protein [Verrucomicrobiae bacterium]
MVKNIFIRFRILIILCAAILLLGVFISTRATADTPQQKDGRMVTIYDGETEKVVITKGKTIADALKKADITVSELDSVEPAATTELVAKNYQVNIYRARPVTIIDGESRVKVMTAHQSAKKIAEQANIPLYDEDISAINRVDDVVDDGGAGLKLTIDRAIPFTIKLYGKKTTMRTQADTVGAMLAEKGIKLAKNDDTSLPLSTKIAAGMNLEVWRNGKQTMTQEETVQFEVEQIQDADREVGYREVKTPGVPGKKTVTYEIVMKNGKEVSRKIIQSVVTKQPEKQVEIVGAKPSFTGDFAAALAQLRACESGGNYQINTGNGYYGAYQYDVSTWAGYEGYTIPSEAPPAVQDRKAWETYQRRGWSPWPSCGAKLPDTYR